MLRKHSRHSTQSSYSHMPMLFGRIAIPALLLLILTGFTGNPFAGYWRNDATSLYVKVSPIGFGVPGEKTNSGTDPVFIGAGDIANCNTPYAEATAKLLDTIPGTVYTLGDNAYPDGTASDFADCFAPTWGRHLSRIRPSPGNHDYHVNGAAGYYTYFGTAASPLDNNCTVNCKGYYSYELGAWHIIALNSEIDMGVGSEQEVWLRQDLAAHLTACTLAYWHKPRFSSGDHQNNTRSQAIWEALYEYGADVILNGHDHNYERFAPQNPAAELEPTRGIREFVVGTGGTGQRAMGTIQPNSEVTAVEAWGLLKLLLHPTSYTWEFVPIAGQSFQDSGTSPCVQLVVPENVLERRVAQSADDAEEAMATATVSLTSTDLELGAETGATVVSQIVGMRFGDLTLPKQISITQAYIEFTVDEVSNDATSLEITGEATGNAAPFVDSSGNLTARPTTAAVVAWPDAAAWPVINAKMRTPDLSPIVQELVDRPDWSSGNAMVFLVQGTGRRTAVAFDGAQPAAPLLHIEYETAKTTASHLIYLPFIQQ